MCLEARQPETCFAGCGHCMACPFAALSPYLRSREQHSPNKYASTVLFAFSVDGVVAPLPAAVDLSSPLVFFYDDDDGGGGGGGDLFRGALAVVNTQERT